ncbi:hypothetical protein HXX02_11195 [Microbulbifer elongatus]|uniref:DUF4239 domain-containing protein n=1 Tax=Microbulbifer elongatus TaxID=86173 RepID=A0ABT1P1N7_9GAMM|nr:hypothetical protein [Microbulbifer elongatus]MCQ3830013.1 hypothetical protein [Microbulbifer elongatus]
MFADNFFHAIPLPAIYFFTVFWVIVTLWFGLVLGRRYMRRQGSEKEPSIGSAVTATLGLLAFLLAFTFNMTADRYNKRKALLLDEVNAIHTAYLHADFLKPPAARQARALLLEYATLRYFEPTSDAVTHEAIARSVAIQEGLWGLVDGHIAEGYQGAYLRQYVDPVSDIINSHTARVVVGMEYRIPGPIWLALYFITGLAMLAIGFQFGVSRSGSVQLAVTLGLTFGTVILLIADLDRALEGVIIVDQTPMAELRDTLRAAEARR